MTTRRSKAERLAIAAHAAPRLRSARPRKVKLVNAAGEVTGVADMRDVVTGLLKRQAIEIQVDDGVRPKEIACVCGAIRKVPMAGVVPKKCAMCITRGRLERLRARRRKDPAVRERLLARDREYRKDPAVRERLRERDREYQKDPAVRERLRERLKDPAVRERLRARARERRKDPAVRERRLEQQRECRKRKRRR